MDRLRNLFDDLALCTCWPDVPDPDCLVHFPEPQPDEDEEEGDLSRPDLFETE